MTTLYTYSDNNLSFALGNSLTTSFVTTDGETSQLMFTLSDGGTFQGTNGDPLGANGKNSFSVLSNLISGNFRITATNDSAHGVTFVKLGAFDSVYNVIDFTIVIGNGTVSFLNGVKIMASGKIDITTMKNIRIEDVGTSQILSGSAGVTMVANENGQANNVADGIYLGRRNSIEANIGEISLSGRGSSNTGGIGVSINEGTVTTENGNVTIMGTGGMNGIDFDTGVNIQENSVVRGKSIGITGFGGASANGEFNEGIGIFFDSVIEATEGLASLNGTGGSGTNNNRGVDIQLNSTVKGRDVMITGFGGASANGESNEGIGIFLDSIIEATGGLASLNGTGGSGTNRNRGVDIQLNSTVKGRDVMITGFGGASANGESNEGIGIFLDSIIEATGGPVSLNGTGGGGDDSYGTIIGDGVEVRALEISVIGKATDPTYGVVQQRGGKFTGTVIVNSNVVNQKYFPDIEDQSGINGDIMVNGVLVVKIDSSSKNSQLVGTGSINLSSASLIIDDIENENTGDESAVYAIVAGDDITPFASYLNSATLTGISGRRYRIDYLPELITLTSETGTNNIGVVIAGVDSAITSTSGNVTITGIGLDTNTNTAVAVVRATGPNNTGVQVRDGGSITSGGPVGLTVIATGSTDPTSTGTNTAFQLANSGTLTSSTGPVTVVASGGNVENNGGVVNAETVNVTQTGPVTINIVDKNNPPTPPLTSGTVDLSQSELVINDQGYQNGEQWVIVRAETVIPFKDNPSTVISNTGTLYLIEYTKTDIILTRVFEPEPEPEPDCGCKPGHVNIQIDLGVCLNIKGKISGKISICR